MWSINNFFIRTFHLYTRWWFLNLLIPPCPWFPPMTLAHICFLILYLIFQYKYTGYVYVINYYCFCICYKILIKVKSNYLYNVILYHVISWAPSPNSSSPFFFLYHLPVNAIYIAFFIWFTAYARFLPCGPWNLRSQRSCQSTGHQRENPQVSVPHINPDTDT